MIRMAISNHEYSWVCIHTFLCFRRCFGAIIDVDDMRCSCPFLACLRLRHVVCIVRLEVDEWHVSLLPVRSICPCIQHKLLCCQAYSWVCSTKDSAATSYCAR